MNLPTDYATNRFPLTLTRREALRLIGLGLLAPGFPSLLTGCGSDDDDSSLTYAATIADARAAILKAMADTHTPSVSVALVDDQRIIWAEAFGVIDKEKNLAPTTATRFCIGSCSKVLAAMSTLILVERGLVELDAPLVRYVQDFAMLTPEAARITIRQLLSHAPGLPGTNFINLFTQTPHPEYSAQTQAALAEERLKHDPGEMAVYCNDGFTLIERLVEAVTGRSYPKFVTEEILAPTGMTDSAYPLEPLPAGSFAPAFVGDAPQPQEFTNGFATGGLYATPSNMGRLARLLLQGGILDGRRILSAASVAEMARDQTRTLAFNPVPTFQWGLGWDDVSQKGLAAVGVKAWAKNGGTLFYGSEFFVLPEARLGLAMSGTTLSYGSAKLAERILFNALVESGQLAAMPVPLAATPLPEVPVDDQTLAAMAGYFAKYDAVVKVEVQADRALTLSTYQSGVWTEAAKNLKYRTDGTFSSDASPLHAYRPLTTDVGDYLVVRIPWGYGHCLLELPYVQRIPSRSARAPGWDERLGRKWLLVNEAASSWILRLEPPRLELEALPTLLGYVAATFMGTQLLDASQDGRRTRMWMKIPVNNGRDLDDLVIEDREGEEWVRFGRGVFRPLDSVPVLQTGGVSLTIEVEDHAQWLQVSASGTLAVRNAIAWLLYDADFAFQADGEGDGSVALPGSGKPAWLMVYGAPGAVVEVQIIA
ncbi:MAG: beta-lactamase family protein [Candidatus Contendobacter sp.]|jgi:CubicO group peptidase (beta-lactamase class C family)|nr:beta-lactamase family protein [Gammaproteobacteria bacterium]MCC8994378.1 beta-lactamase family protein [Candidatus Contendobacter sp.]